MPPALTLVWIFMAFLLCFLNQSLSRMPPAFTFALTFMCFSFGFAASQQPGSLLNAGNRRESDHGFARFFWQESAGPPFTARKAFSRLQAANVLGWDGPRDFSSVS